MCAAIAARPVRVAVGWTGRRAEWIALDETAKGKGASLVGRGPLLRGRMILEHWVRAREPAALHQVNAQAQAARAASVAVNAGLAHRPYEGGSKGCRSPCHRILPFCGSLYSTLFKGEYNRCPGTARDESAQPM